MQIRVFTVTGAAISNLLELLDPGQGAKVTYRGYPNDDYVVVLDNRTNWDANDGCDTTGITPIEDRQQERDLLDRTNATYAIGDNVTVRGWAGEGLIEEKSVQWWYEADEMAESRPIGPSFGVMLLTGHKVWVPVSKSQEVLQRA